MSSEFEAAKAALNPKPTPWRRCPICLTEMAAGQQRCPDHPDSPIHYVRKLTPEEQAKIGNDHPEAVLLLGEE